MDSEASIGPQVKPQEQVKPTELKPVVPLTIYSEPARFGALSLLHQMSSALRERTESNSSPEQKFLSERLTVLANLTEGNDYRLPLLYIRTKVGSPDAEKTYFGVRISRANEEELIDRDGNKLSRAQVLNETLKELRDLLATKPEAMKEAKLSKNESVYLSLLIKPASPSPENSTSQPISESQASPSSQPETETTPETTQVQTTPEPAEPSETELLKAVAREKGMMTGNDVKALIDVMVPVDQRRWGNEMEAELQILYNTPVLSCEQVIQVFNLTGMKFNRKNIAGAIKDFQYAAKDQKLAENSRQHYGKLAKALQQVDYSVQQRLNIDAKDIYNHESFIREYFRVVESGQLVDESGKPLLRIGDIKEFPGVTPAELDRLKNLGQVGFMAFLALLMSLDAKLKQMNQGMIAA